MKKIKKLISSFLVIIIIFLSSLLIYGLSNQVKLIILSSFMLTFSVFNAYKTWKKERYVNVNIMILLAGSLIMLIILVSPINNELKNNITLITFLSIIIISTIMKKILKRDK